MSFFTICSEIEEKIENERSMLTRPLIKTLHTPLSVFSIVVKICSFAINNYNLSNHFVLLLEYLNEKIIEKFPSITESVNFTELNNFVLEQSLIFYKKLSELSFDEAFEKVDNRPLTSKAASRNKGKHMEDRGWILTLPDIANVSCCCVFDGHGGAECVELASCVVQHYFLNNWLLPHWQRYKSDNGHSVGVLRKALELSKNAESDLKDTCSEQLVSTENMLLDALACAESELQTAKRLNSWGGGSTCTALCVEPSMLNIAWLGDSEAWLVMDDGSGELLTDPIHNCKNQFETDRVTAEGGWIDEYRRLCGRIAVTRALGDSASNLPGMSAKPSFRQIVRQTRQQAVVLASDGLWETESCSGPEVALEVVRFLKEDNECAHSSDLAQHLLQRAQAAGAVDNCVVIVVLLDQIASV